MKVLKTIGSRLLSAVRLLLGAALLLILPLLMIYLNYSIDCSGYFQGALELRETANMVLAGQDFTGFDKLNNSERDIMKIFANNIDPLPEWIALGSSRILQLSSDILQHESFFNCGMTGGDAADVLGTFWLFDREDRLPKTIIIGFDPWLLRDDDYAWDKRSDKELYAEFLNTKLGYNITYEKPDTTEKWKALYSPQYFQDNVKYFLQSKDGNTQPKPVEGDVYNQEAAVKRGDGSLLYEVPFRTRPLEERAADALYMGLNLLRMTEYPRLGRQMPEIFDRFFAYAKERGVNIVLVLSPYHPLTYDYVTEHADEYKGFLQTEPAVRKLAEKYDFKVFGSYNPHNIPGVTEKDFYDGLHPSGDCLRKIIWGATEEEIKEAAQQVADKNDKTDKKSKV